MVLSLYYCDLYAKFVNCFNLHSWTVSGILCSWMSGIFIYIAESHSTVSGLCNENWLFSSFHCVVLCYIVPGWRQVYVWPITHFKIWPSFITRYSLSVHPKCMVTTIIATSAQCDRVWYSNILWQLYYGGVLSYCDVFHIGIKWDIQWENFIYELTET